VGDRADWQAVIAHHGPIAAGDIGLRAVGLLVGEGKALQKTVEFFFAAIECGEFVIGAELLDRVERARSSTLRVLRSFASRDFGFGAASSAVTNARLRG